MDLIFEFTSPELLIWGTALLFFAIAFAYSSVGLGGGSSYTALMAILGFNFLAIPIISLVLNISVTTVGAFNYLRNKHGRLNLILPFLVSSIPFSYLGGMLQFSKELFFPILLITLAFVLARLLLFEEAKLVLQLGGTQKIIISIVIGALLGLVSGIVGIGGGIYLVPLVIVFGLGSEKEAAASGAIFIWLNSFAGLSARLQHNMVDFSVYLPLIFSVVIGGFLGSFFGATKFSKATLQKLLSLVISIALIFLLKKVFFFS